MKYKGRSVKVGDDLEPTANTIQLHCVYMLSKILPTLLAATVASAAVLSSTPIPTTSSPKFELTVSDLGFSRARISAKNVDLTPEAALVNPTLLLCGSANCASNCFRLTVVGVAQNTCFTPSNPTSFLSVAIDNPDATTIPFAVLVGNCASSLTKIPQSNNCFNINPAGSNFETTAGSTTSA